MSDSGIMVEKLAEAKVRGVPLYIIDVEFNVPERITLAIAALEVKEMMPPFPPQPVPEDKAKAPQKSAPLPIRLLLASKNVNV